MNLWESRWTTPENRRPHHRNHQLKTCTRSRVATHQQFALLTVEDPPCPFTSPRRASKSRSFVPSPSTGTPSLSPSKRVHFASDPVSEVAIIPSASTPDGSAAELTRMASRSRGSKQNEEAHKRETVALATEVLVHSMRGTPKSVLMLERLGAKLWHKADLKTLTGVWT